jgi:Universal stress protein family.
MAEHTSSSAVPITVPQQTSGADTETYLRSGPLVDKPAYTVVVPITATLLDTSTGLNVNRLLQTAVALAADKEGRVLLLGIERITDEAALETVREYVDSGQQTAADAAAPIEGITDRRAKLAEMVAMAEELAPTVSISAAVRVLTDVTDGILATVDGESETAVLLLRGAGLDEGWLFNRSTIDTVVADADCDVFVENVGGQHGQQRLYIPAVDDHTVATLAAAESKTIDSILLPVESGPHSALAAEAARAVARENDAAITILQVIPSDASAEERSEGQDLLKFADYVVGSDVQITTKLQEATEPIEAIIETANDHDLVTIGASEQGSRLTQLVYDSVHDTLSAESEATILMARDADRIMRSLYYRWKRGIESLQADEETNN